MDKESGSEALIILKAVLSLSRRLRAERPHGSVSLAAISILGTLHQLGPMAATRLAAEERLQPQSLTRIIAALENEGLVARTRSDTDRREMSIALTNRGLRSLTDDLRARRAWLETAMAAVLNERERKLLVAACETMVKLAFCEDHGGEGAE
jgi:DNA-binding MarR family transcriptional regulator